MTKLTGLALCVLLSSCSSNSGSDAPAAPAPADPQQQQAPGGFIAGFDPPPAPAGYQRIVTPAVQGLAPGSDTMFCQYVGGAADADTDVIDLVGAQSKGGHHLVLYATQMAAPIGTSHVCTTDDMLSVRYLGAIGGEGTGSVSGHDLPPGTVFRIPKGQALLANAHYINTTDHPIDGQAAIDIKTAPADPSKKVITLFTNVATQFSVPASQSGQADATCVAGQDMDVFYFGNHMHNYGTSVFSQLVRANGEKVSLREDPTWRPEEEFNPVFAKWPLTAPVHIAKGDTVQTHCTWQNTTNGPIGFPTEMCVGIGFFVGPVEMDCVDGHWPGK
jgi:hypothetical protein